MLSRRALLLFLFFPFLLFSFLLLQHFTLSAEWAMEHCLSAWWDSYEDTIYSVTLFSDCVVDSLTHLNYISINVLPCSRAHTFMRKNANSAMLATLAHS